MSGDQGLFSDERVMQFLIMMKAIAEQCFQQLHRVSRERDVPKDIAADSFLVGLKYVEQWGDSIVSQEATNAIAKYPDIVGGYKHCLVEFVKHLHRTKRAQVQLHVPPFKSFLHWFLVRVAQSPQLQRSGLTWVPEASFYEKDVFYREMLRQTLAQDCLPNNLQITPQVARDAPAAATMSLEDALSLRGGGHQQRSPHPMECEDPVYPSDSISNVPAPPSSVAASHAPTALVQQLTPSLVHMHTEYPSTTASAPPSSRPCATESVHSAGDTSVAASLPAPASTGQLPERSLHGAPCPAYLPHPQAITHNSPVVAASPAWQQQMQQLQQHQLHGAPLHALSGE